MMTVPRRPCSLAGLAVSTVAFSISGATAQAEAPTLYKTALRGLDASGQHRGIVAGTALPVSGLTASIAGVEHGMKLPPLTLKVGRAVLRQRGLYLTAAQLLPGRYASLSLGAKLCQT